VIHRVLPAAAVGGNMYDAVCFDNDGVLVSRTPYDLLQEAAWAAFEAAGVEEPAAEDVESMVIGVTPETVETVARTYDLDPDDFWRRRDRVMSERQQAAVRDGRKSPYEDVGALAALSVPMGIVSSNQQATVDFLVEYFGFEGFGVALGREPTIESLRRRKPNPHYLERAVETLGGESVLFVGDNDSDIAAAEAAGVDSAFIRRPHRRRHDPEPTPTYVVEDLHEVVSLCRRAGP
jgi:HAD superfamily hydrolase (TIGR01549 family)